jgi:hypothetical protein
MATVLVDERNAFGVDKIERYGWRLHNAPGDLRHIHKNELSVGAVYQRESYKHKILEISRNWNWIACGTIAVAKVGKKFRVMDGQHRVLAARNRSDVTELPCIVFETEDVAEEARGFLALNTLRKPVSIIDKHKAQLIAEDETALKIQKTLDDLGLTIVKSAKGPGQFGALAMAYRRSVEDHQSFAKVLGFAAEITRNAGMPVAEKLVDGLWYIDRNYEGGVTERKIAARIRHVGGDRLLEGALRAAAYFARGGSRVFAQGMMDVLNKGIHSKFELNLQ